MKNSLNINHARILLVEDHKNLALAVGAYLESSGFTMDYAYDGLCGLHLVTTQHYDAIILDVMLPGIDGLETYKRILDINPSQKTIIVSGFSETDRVKEAQDLGAGPYVKKPYVREKLGLAIRRELDRPLGG